MNATIGNNPSFIWRSLLWSREVIQNGIIWKAGNGLSINARRDTWIPSLASGRISSNVSYKSNTPINNLFADDLSWDINKLQSLFLPYGVEAIKRIPIDGPNTLDNIYWRWEKKWHYTVKIGCWYTFNKHTHDNTNDVRGSGYAMDSLWQKI